MITLISLNFSHKCYAFDSGSESKIMNIHNISNIYLFMTKVKVWNENFFPYLQHAKRCRMKTAAEISKITLEIYWLKYEIIHPPGQNSILQSCRIGFVNCERLCAVLGFRHILCLHAHGFALPKSEIRIEKSEIASNEMAISFMDIPLWLGNVLWNSSKSEIKAMPKNFVQFVSSELEVSEWVSEWLSVCVCVGWLALSSIWCCALP